MREKERAMKKAISFERGAAKANINVGCWFTGLQRTKCTADEPATGLTRFSLFV
jgi:hypothetical protein